MVRTGLEGPRWQHMSSSIADKTADKNLKKQIEKYMQWFTQWYIRRLMHVNDVMRALMHGNAPSVFALTQMLFANLIIIYSMAFFPRKY
jgi:hypothetical protein